MKGESEWGLEFMFIWIAKLRIHLLISISLEFIVHDIFFLTIFTFRHFPVLIPVPYNSYKIEFSPHQHAVVSQFLGTVSLILCLLLWLTIWTYLYLNLTVHKVVVNVFISHGA